jgi:ABC-type sugar transport system substrate-binding protein/anti-anti-sigma regulatory factor
MNGNSLDRADLAQEVRWLRDVTDALSDAKNLTDVLRVIGQGIKNVIPYTRWQSMSITLGSANSRLFDQYRTNGKLADAYWGNVGIGVLSAANKLGVSLRFEAAEVDEAFQVQAIDRAIAEGVDGIAVAPINPTLLEPAIARARAAGIPVITFDTPPIEGSAALLYIGTDNLVAGRIAGEVMGHLLPQGGIVGAGVYYLQALNSRQRLAGFTETIADHGLAILPPLDVQGLDNLGVSEAMELLAHNPDLAGVFGVCGINGPAWGAAALATGRAEALKILAFDIGPDMIDLLKRGVVHAVIAQRETEMGSKCVEILCRMIVEGVQATLGRYPASRVVDTGVDVITLEERDWSLSLADYLVKIGEQGGDQGLREALAQRPERPRLVVIGMATPSDVGMAMEQVGLEQNSLLKQVWTSQKRQVVKGPDGLQVGLPLFARGKMLGVLGFESNTLAEGKQAEYAQFERIARTIALLIDNTMLINAFEAHSRELGNVNAQQELLIATIRQLSTPVVTITRDILVLPLVGVIDSARIQEITHSLLEAIGAYDARIVIVDITGVKLIDSAVAAGLINAARAARLLGTEVVFVGITPLVAQTLVSLGVDFSGAVTYSNLQSGFAHALARTGGKIVYS